MNETKKEFDWYSEKIEAERRESNRLWGIYSESRDRLQRLERGRHDLFQRMLQEADARLKCNDR